MDTATTTLSISDIHEERQCCCCINWYNDRKSKMNIKKGKSLGQKLMIEISRSDAKKLQQIFKQLDTDNDGKLSQSDLGLAMKQLGFDMSHSMRKLDIMFEKADLNNDGKLNFQEFALAIIKKAPYLFAKP